MIKEVNALIRCKLNSYIKNVKPGNSLIGKKIAFIVPSVINTSNQPLDYSSVRSVYSLEERLFQTKETVFSIRRYCPDSSIVLVEAGSVNYSDRFNSVDNYLFVGDVPSVRRAVDSSFKGWGEAEMLKTAFEKTTSYDFIFKLSGRYRLDERFSLERFDALCLNFKNYVSHSSSFFRGRSSYLKGSHSTRLYGVPKQYFNLIGEEFDRLIPELQKGIGLESIFCSGIEGKAFYYVDCLGVCGNIAVDGNLISE